MVSMSEISYWIPGILRIVKERTLGLSYKEIADNLNKDLVPTVLSGKKWYASTVREIYIRVS